MRLARFDIDGSVVTGVVKDGAVVSLGPLFEGQEESRSLDAIIRSADRVMPEIAAYTATTAPTAKVEELTLLAPLTSPRKIVAIGSNYLRPGTGAAGKSPPVLFFKPPSSLCGPNDRILLPPEAEWVVGEVELAVVIGKSGDRIAAAHADEHVFGLMVANDVTAPKVLLGESAKDPLLLQQSRGKGFRSFCPTGPWIQVLESRRSLTDDLILEQHVDEFLDIRGQTSTMIIDVPNLLADISSAFGLEAGDIVLTGSPPPLAGARKALSPGVTLYSSISGIGSLANPVTASEDRYPPPR